MKDYPPLAFKNLCAYIRRDKDAKQWLEENDCKELVEFWDAYEGMEKSFQWLKSNGFVHFAALVDAMSDQTKAKIWLMQNGFATLAAFADAAEGNKTAVALLLKAGEKGWLTVAKEISDYHKKKQKNWLGGLFNFGNPYQ